MSHHYHAHPLRLLVAIDGTPESAAAISFAFALAGEAAHVVLLHVVRTLEVPLPLPEAVIEHRGVLRDQRRQRIGAQLRTMAATLHLARPELAIETVVTEGDPAQQVQRVAAAHDADLIVLATHHRHPMDAVLDSVATRVAMEAPIPVMVVRMVPGSGHHQFAPVLRLIVPLDGSARAAEALPVAVRLASHLHVPIHLVTVIDPAAVLPPAFAYDVEGAGVLPDELAGLEAEARAALDRAEKRVRLAGVPVAADLLLGSRIERIKHLAQPGDVIVLTTRGMSERRDTLLGHVAAHLIREAPVPVLVVHMTGTTDVLVRALPEPAAWRS